jgi:hypothetical protein
MLQIGNTIISTDILEAKFACDLSICKGACCVQGDSGAPLEDEELDALDAIFPKIRPYLSEGSLKAIEEQGTFVVDSDGDNVTPLVEGKECAYVYFENEVAKCAIEKAYFDGKIKFRKPVSCHLYPIRVKKYKEFSAINYHQWQVCKPAIDNGKSLLIPLHGFLKDALTRKFGKEWYKQVEIASNLYAENKLKL